MRIPENELTRYNAHGVGPAIAPVRESVLGRRPDMNVRRPPAAFANRQVVARTAPPPAPVPFARQQEAIRANGGRPLARSQITQLQPAAAANSRVRLVAPGPARPIQGGGFGTARPGQPGGVSGNRPGAAADRPGQQFGTARPGQAAGAGGDRAGSPADRAAQQGGIPGNARPNIDTRREPTLQERERTLHATPIPPSPQQNPTQNGAFGTPGASIRNDRPANQMRNDQYRMQNTEESRRQAQEVRPTPEARPIEPQRPVAPQQPVEQSRQLQARPIEPRAAEQARQFQARPIQQPPAAEQPRRFEQPPQFQARPTEQSHVAEQPRQVPQARPIEQPRAVEQQRQFQARPIEQPRQEFRAERAPDPRPIQRAEQPRQEARPIEAPRAAPPQPRQAPPAQQQQQRGEDRRGRPDPRNRQ